MFILLTIGYITVHRKRNDEQWARKYLITDTQQIVQCLRKKKKLFITDETWCLTINIYDFKYLYIP